MSRDEATTTRGETRDGAAHRADDDVLVRALRELPVRGPSSTSGRPSGAPAAARATFVRAFDDAPWYVKPLSGAARASVPVLLASVVGLYLFWALSTAIALNQ